MKKILFLLSMLAIATWGLQAQETKLRVAVFDPTSSGTAIDEGTKVAVRELISSTLVNTGKYTIVERSLLQQVMKEQRMTNSDNFDESQATQLGKLAGANKVVLSVVQLVGGRNMLSIKIIDVQTATIDQQKTKIAGSNDLLDIVEPLALELLGEPTNYNRQPNSQSSQNTASVSKSSSPHESGNLMLGEKKVTTYEQAESFCRSSGKDGFRDWRVPAIEELNQVYKQSELSRADTRVVWYWSSTCKDSKCSVLEVKNMVSGTIGTAPRRKEINVMCVR